MAAVLPARPACDSSPATPGAQSIKVSMCTSQILRILPTFVYGASLRLPAVLNASLRGSSSSSNFLLLAQNRLATLAATLCF